MPEFYIRITIKVYHCDKLQFLSTVGKKLNTFDTENYFSLVFLVYTVLFNYWNNMHVLHNRKYLYRYIMYKQIIFDSGTYHSLKI